MLLAHIQNPSFNFHYFLKYSLNTKIPVEASVLLKWSDEMKHNVKDSFDIKNLPDDALMV